MNLFPVQTDKTKRARPFRFTLIELLVVVAIMGVIIAVGLPAFEKLTIGSGVDAAARQISAQLRLARQYAISNRCKVAIVMPSNQAGISDTYRYTSFRPAVVTGAGPAFVWSKWVDGSKWTFLPTGAALDVDNVITTIPASTSTLPQSVNTVPVPTASGTTSVAPRAVVFSATGAQAGTTTPVIIVMREAFYNGTLQSRGSGKNRLVLEINPYTGRTKIQ